MLLNEFKTKLTDFDPEAGGYSKINALFLGEASQAAYGSPDAAGTNGMQAWASMVGFADCIPFGADSGIFEKGRIEGFVAKADKLMLVSFRGTDPTVGDWLIDFHTIPQTDPLVPGQLHRGFHEAMLSVWGQIRPHLDNRGNRRVWFTGHSLGGALAVASAAQATFESPRIGIRGIYTYGQPRYGNGTCSLACEGLLGSVLFRHINDRDIVPRVPPFLLGFRHFGAEILFDQAGKVHFRSSAVEEPADLLRRLLVDPLDFATVTSVLKGNGEEAAIRKLRDEEFDVVTDHFMDAAYLPTLRKEAAG